MMAVVVGLGIALVILLEGAAQLAERRTRHATLVASDPESDHQMMRSDRSIRTGSVLAALGSMGVAAAVAAPLWVILAVLIIFATLRLGLVRMDHAVAERSRSVRFVEALRAPEFPQAPLALFFSAADLLKPDHVLAWKKELDSVGVDWFVICAEPWHFKTLRQETGAHAVLLPDDGQSLSFLPKSLRSILYVNNAQNNCRVIKAIPDAIHVQMLHGDSDKPPSYSPLTKNYDRVFVAGQMGIDRYSRNGVYIPEDRFRIVGRPQVALLSTVEHGKRRDRAPDQPFQVVYMPTWRGFYEDTQFSSLEAADEIIERILSAPRKVELLFKPHPLSHKDPDWPDYRKRITATLKKRRANGSSGQICSLDTETFDLYNKADLLICDISSVMIDFLYTNKPFVTILPKGFWDERRSNFPSLAASYEVRNNLENLEEAVDEALGDDPLQAMRSAIRATAFGDLHLAPGAAFRQACLELVSSDEDQRTQ